MKKIFGLILFIILVTPVGVFAHGEETGSEMPGLETTLQGILDNHQVQNISELNCNKVTDHEWEDLGEAVMSQMHPDPTQHEMMDNMMGGEGSESLQQAHIGMGQNYLGCSASRGVMGMMGSNMMGSGWGAGWGVLGLVFWLAAIAALVAITRYFWKKGSEVVK